jgi:hypothetical protein
MKKSSPIFFLFLICSTLQAYDDPITDLLKQEWLGSTNAAIALVADENIGAGKYYVGYDGGPPSTISMYQFPYTHHFPTIDKHLNFFATASYAYAKMNIIPEADFMTEMHMLKLGGGIRYEHDPLKYVQLKYALIYSSSHNSVNKNSPYYNYETKPFFDYVTDHSQYTWTNEYAVQIKYGVMYHAFIPYINLEYNQYDSRSNVSLSSLASINSDTELFHTTVGCFTPTLAEIYEHEVTLEGYIGRNFFHGDMQHIIPGDYYDTYGVTLHLPMESESLYEGFEITSEWTNGDQFYGYNAGIGFNTKF